MTPFFEQNYPLTLARARPAPLPRLMADQFHADSCEKRPACLTGTPSADGDPDDHCLTLCDIAGSGFVAETSTFLATYRSGQV